MAYDPIEALRSAGSPVDQLSDSQRAVLSTLSADEVGVLIDVQSRVAAAGNDVEGHDVIGGGIF